MRPLAFLCAAFVSCALSASTLKIGADAVERARSNEPTLVIVALRAPAAKTRISVEMIRRLQDDVLSALPANSFQVTARWDHVPAFAGVMTAEAIAALEA